MNAPLMETLMESADTPRAFRRFALSVTVGVILSSDKALVRGAVPLSSIPATMTNASLSGLCFSSPTEFPVGTLIQVEMSLGSQTHQVPAVVRRSSRVKRLGRTFYESGAQYLKSEATSRFLPLMATYLLTQGVDKSVGAPNS